MKKLRIRHLVIVVIVLVIFGLGIRLGEVYQANKPIILNKLFGTGTQIHPIAVQCFTNNNGSYSCDDLVKENTQTLITSCDSYYQGLVSKNNRTTGNTTFCTSIPDFIGGFSMVCR